MIYNHYYIQVATTLLSSDDKKKILDFSGNKSNLYLITTKYIAIHTEISTEYMRFQFTDRLAFNDVNVDVDTFKKLVTLLTLDSNMAFSFAKTIIDNYENPITERY